MTIASWAVAATNSLSSLGYDVDTTSFAGPRNVFGRPDRLFARYRRVARGKAAARAQRAPRPAFGNGAAVRLVRHGARDAAVYCTGSRLVAKGQAALPGRPTASPQLLRHRAAG